MSTSIKLNPARLTVLSLIIVFLTATLSLTPDAHTQTNDTKKLVKETLIAHFAAGPNATTSKQEYSGLVTITVTGIGQASATQYSDAFYILTDFAGNPIEPWHPTLNYNWVLWINGQHAENLIPGQAVPPYREDHTYTFLIEAPGGPLTFGVGDIGTGDNTGSYTITLGEPSACSIPFFSQRDSRWINHPLRTSGACSSSCNTIGACGCTLTSATMLFSYYGVELTPPALSDCMGNSACPFSWSTGAACTRNKVQYVETYNFSWERLEQELNQNISPVLLGMHRLNNPKDTHWVLVTSGTGNDPSNYLIHDPWPLQGADTNLAVYFRQNYVFSRLVVYDGEPNCNNDFFTLRSRNSALGSTLLTTDNKNKDDLTNAFNSERNSTSTVEGSAIVYHVYETSLVVQLSAQSTAGNITEMRVWTDSIDSPTWKPFETMVWLPWNPGDQVYVRFRDEYGNESIAYEDTLQPHVGPPNTPDLDKQILFPVVIGSKN